MAAGRKSKVARAFNHGIVEPEGRTLRMTGQVAWDGEGRLVGAGDCETQIRQCFDNVERILAAVGGRFEDLVSLTIYFLDPADLPAIQKVRAETLAPEIAPDDHRGQHSHPDARAGRPGAARRVGPGRDHPI